MSDNLQAPGWLEQVRKGQSPERPWFAFLCAASTWASVLILAVLLLSVAENALGVRDWVRYLQVRLPVTTSVRVLVQSHDKSFHGVEVPALPVRVIAHPELETNESRKSADEPSAGAKVRIIQTHGSTVVSPGQQADSFEVSLASVPTGHLVVTLRPGDLVDLGSGPGAEKRLRFTPQNALQPQRVEVSSQEIRPQSWLDWQFVSSYDSLDPRKAGMLAGILGTFWVVSLTLLIAIPVGVGAAVYLEEYAAENWLTRLIRINLANLAGVPSIVYGILGLTAFVHMFSLFSQNQGIWWITSQERYLIPFPLGPTVIAGSLTMSLLILPVIIVSSQEALRAVPPSLRHASLALGATRWQTVRHQVVPAAFPGIITGIILAMSRAIGETAPLLMVGAIAFVLRAPGKIDSLSSLVTNPGGLIEAPFSSYSVMPIQIYTWIGSSQREYHHLAAAGIVVLLVILLILNGVATYLRYRFEKYTRW